MDRQTTLRLLRWLIVSTLLGAAIGLGIGITKDAVEMTLPVGAGLGLILGFVLASLQRA